MYAAGFFVVWELQVKACRTSNVALHKAAGRGFV